VLEAAHIAAQKLLDKQFTNSIQRLQPPF